MIGPVPGLNAAIALSCGVCIFVEDIGAHLHVALGGRYGNCLPKVEAVVLCFDVTFDPVQPFEGLEYMHLSLDSSLSGDEARERIVNAQHVEAFEFGLFVEHSNQRRDAKAALSFPQGSVHKNRVSFHSILLEVFEKNSQ
jgi:hypothetical protein